MDKGKQKAEFINHANVGTQAQNAYHYGDIYIGHHGKSGSSNSSAGYLHGLNLFGAPGIEQSLFIGREEETNQMKNILQSDDAKSHQQILILGGLGGVGKTQLAIAYSKQFQGYYSTILWLNATTEETLNSSLRSVAKKFFQLTEVKGWNDEDVQDNVSKWLSERDNNQWLLIFDNHDNPSSYQISKYFPYTAQGSIIITTRVPESLNGSKIKLKVLSNEEDGLKILETRSGRDLSADTGAKGLVKRMDGLPLALATAASFVKKTGIKFEDYLRQYEEKWYVSPGLERPISLPEYQWTLYTTWEISFNQLKEQDENAANLLLLLSYFSNQDISYEMIQAGTISTEEEDPRWFLELAGDKFLFCTTMSTLIEYCFVETQPESTTYSLHTCVHDWISEGLNKRVDSTYYWIAVRCICDFYPKDEDGKDSMAMIHQKTVTHATRLAHNRFEDMLKQEGVTLYEVINALKIAKLLYSHQQYAASENIYQRALVYLEQILGPKHKTTLAATSELAMVFRGHGKLDQAEELYQHALSEQEDILGPMDPATLITMNNLGNLYVDQRRYQEAEKMFQQSLQRRQETLGHKHLDTLAALDNYASVHTKQSKFIEAELMFRHSLTSYEELLGPKHSRTIFVVNNLAIVCKDQGKLSEAEQFFQRALAGMTENLGPKNQETLRVTDSLAATYHEQGRLFKAEELYQKVIADREEVLGLEHPDNLKSLANLGALYETQGKLDEAEKTYQKADHASKFLGLNHPDVLQITNNLGNLYFAQSQLDEAEQMFQKALAGMGETFGSKHPETIRVVNNLGVLYQAQAKPFEAEEMFQKALTGREEIYGQRHPLTLSVVRNIASLYHSQGKLSEAEQMYTRVLVGELNIFGPMHPSIPRTTISLAVLYEDQGKLQDAEQLWKRALEIQEKVLGPNHPHTLKTMDNLKRLRDSQGNLNDVTEEVEQLKI